MRFIGYLTKIDIALDVEIRFNRKIDKISMETNQCEGKQIDYFRFGHCTLRLWASTVDGK